MERGLIVGLTGGIACGKSTVASLLKELGAYVINLDAIGHQLLKQGNPVYDEVLATYGLEILDRQGEISREKLGRIVFNNQESRKKLNAIMHPRIVELSRTEARQIVANAPETVVVIDSPLLIEAGMQHTVDTVVVVVASEQTQLNRLLARGVQQGRPLSQQDAQARIHSQMPLAEKVKSADFVLENNGTLDELQAEVAKLWKKLNFLKAQRKIPLTNHKL